MKRDFVRDGRFPTGVKNRCRVPREPGEDETSRAAMRECRGWRREGEWLCPCRFDSAPREPFSRFALDLDQRWRRRMRESLLLPACGNHFRERLPPPRPRQALLHSRTVAGRRLANRPFPVAWFDHCRCISRRQDSLNKLAVDEVS